MKVLLVEPWWGGSHQQWAEGYARHTAHELKIIHRPGSNWRERMRTAGTELAAEANAIMKDGWVPDVILATDMMNLADFRRSLLGRVPLALYMHENQLTYTSEPDEFYGNINVESLLAADLTIFNSRYHWSSFGEGLMALQKGGLNLPGALIAWQKAVVVPVGVDFLGLDQTDHDHESPIILWSHRWETDKDPAAFALALEQVSDLDWRLILLGEHAQSTARDRIVADFADRIVHEGWVEASHYAGLVSQADIVVSTARQEFFGVSVAEAVGAGAFPVVPNRLSYPELLGDNAPDESLYSGHLDLALRWAIDHLDRAGELATDLAPSIRRFAWPLVGSRMDMALETTAGK